MVGWARLASPKLRFRTRDQRIKRCLIALIQGFRHGSKPTKIVVWHRRWAWWVKKDRCGGQMASTQFCRVNRQIFVYIQIPLDVRDKPIKNNELTN